MIKISQLDEDTIPTSNDVIPITDVESGITKKAKLFNLASAVLNNPSGQVAINGAFVVGGQTSAGVPTGGKMYITGDGLNNNKVFIEFFSRDDSTNASEVAITGRFTGNLPYLKLFADNVVYRGSDGIERNWTDQWTAYTPVFSGGTVAGTSKTYSYQRGWYKVIGKTCFFSVDIQMSSFGTASGTANISLPVAAATRFEQPVAGYVCGVGSNPSTSGAGAPTVYGANLYFLSGVNTGTLQVSSCTTNTVFRANGSYEIA